MASVKAAINDLRVQQDNLQSQIEEVETKIKQIQSENYEIEQTKLSLQHQEILLKQKIENASHREQLKLDQLRSLQASYGNFEDSAKLTERSNDAYDRYERLLDELKEAQEQANMNDMKYEEVNKRLMHIEQNRVRMERRAAARESEAKRLEEGFKDANNQVEVLMSKDNQDDTDLHEEVAALQRKVDEAIRIAETFERDGVVYKQSIENIRQQLCKQREENEKIRKDMAKMNEIIDIS